MASFMRPDRICARSRSTACNRPLDREFAAIAPSAFSTSARVRQGAQTSESEGPNNTICGTPNAAATCAGPESLPAKKATRRASIWRSRSAALPAPWRYGLKPRQIFARASDEDRLTAQRSRSRCRASSRKDRTARSSPALQPEDESLRSAHPAQYRDRPAPVRMRARGTSPIGTPR